jgi:hypothetical protein
VISPATSHGVTTCSWLVVSFGASDGWEAVVPDGSFDSLLQTAFEWGALLFDGMPLTQIDPAKR